MNIDIVPIPAPASADAPVDPLYEAYAHVFRVEDIDFFGNDDLASTAHELQVMDSDQGYNRTQRWVAFPEGERAPESAIGLAFVELTLTDNTHLAMAHIVTHPEYRGRGVATSLLPTVEAALRESGRTSIQVWANHHPYQGGDALSAKTGVGQIDPKTPQAHWLRTLGFELEQTERHSVLAIPAEGDPWWRELAERRERDTVTAGDEYELLQWKGGIPPEFHDGYARLRERMSVDAPSAELDFEEEKWDAERIAKGIEQRTQSGYEWVSAFVRHIPSGTLVAYTEMMWPGERPAGVWQMDTFVHGEHRGHRLGALVKAANLEFLRRENPAAERIHTWNAGENEYMLAINVELGFAPASIEGGWQKRVTTD